MGEPSSRSVWKAGRSGSLFRFRIRAIESSPTIAEASGPPLQPRRHGIKPSNSAGVALALVIKAKLEAVESGISIFEDEFMANIVLPDGQSVSEFMRPQIALAYDKGDMPKLLPDYSGGRS